MVAFASHSNSIFNRHFYIGGQYRSGTLYLFNILMMTNDKRDKQLETLIIINLLFLIAYLIFKLKVILIVSLILGIICLLFKTVLNIVHTAWNTFFTLLGAINSRILLFIVYFLFLVPLSFLKKTFIKKPQLITDRFKERNHLYSTKDLERMG